jgi:hypothetical protein
LNLAPQNRWIDISTTANNGSNGAEADKITFGHRLINDLTKVNDKIEKNGATVDYLNGSRRSDSKKIPTVYRFGLPEDKSISKLDSDNGNEAANTFNVPYIEIDKAGHVVAAETHTVTVPENFEKITLNTVDVEAEDSLKSNEGELVPITL